MDMAAASTGRQGHAKVSSGVVVVNGRQPKNTGG
jgi:hypothetical protein